MTLNNWLKSLSPWVPDRFGARALVHFADWQIGLQAFSNLPLTPLQTIMFDYRGVIMKATVRSISTLDGSDGDNMGIIMEGTEINWFKDPSSAIKLKNTSNR
jgi:hypothetical protein